MQCRAIAWHCRRTLNVRHMSKQVAVRSDRDALYLVDSSIYIFRAWHTYGQATDSNGRPANAAFGFVDFLYQLLVRRKPTRIACAFDESHGQSVRHSIYPEYKANRPPAPPDLKHQFALCKSFVNACGIAALASPDVEADDIIGMLAISARGKNIASIIVTADKDLCQFVGPDDAAWDYARDTWLDARLVEKRFGIRPHQIPDLLALTGDKVDNIPGIPGVGITTAARLLVKWGNLDALLNNIGKVASMKFRGAAHVSALLQEHRETVLVSRKLTGLHEDKSLKFDIDQLHINPDSSALGCCFDELGFSDRKRTQWHQLLHTCVTTREQGLLQGCKIRV